MGRPKKKIDKDLVKRLAVIHCTNEEIASICKCSKDTIERRFAAIIKKGRDNGKMSLRRWQYEAAQKGNTVMLIWLGKQLLGQKDQFNATPIEANMKIRIGHEDDDDTGPKPAEADAAAKKNTDDKG
jgi:hypothetical protein